MKKEVGRVTEQERDEIQSLFERKNGLKELAGILAPDNDELYTRLVDDMSKTSTKFQQWWNKMSAKYNWESSENGHWEIDFQTCQIFLSEPQ